MTDTTLTAQQSAPDLDKLEALALDLRGLRWSTPTEGTNDGGGRYREVTTEEGDVVFGEFSGPDSAEAAFIAAANPAAVLDLIALARRAAPARVEAAPKAAHMQEITLPDGASLRYEARTTGEPGWLLYGRSNNLIRAASVADVEIIEATISAARSAQPAQACSAQVASAVPLSEHNARFAIDGAIQYGRENRNPPPSTDHWLYEYWNIGRQLATLGATGWDNITPMPESVAATGAEGAQQQTEQQPQANVLPPFAEPAGQHDASIRDAALEQAAHICWSLRARDEFEPEIQDRVLKVAERQIRALKSDVASRCRAQGGNTNCTTCGNPGSAHAVDGECPTESAAAPADGLEQLLIQHRIGLTPESEGGFHAYVFRDSEMFEAKGYGATPRQAVETALATHQPSAQPGEKA